MMNNSKDEIIKIVMDEIEEKITDNSVIVDIPSDERVEKEKVIEALHEFSDVEKSISKKKRGRPPGSGKGKKFVEKTIENSDEINKGFSIEDVNKEISSISDDPLAEKGEEEEFSPESPISVKRMYAKKFVSFIDLVVPRLIKILNGLKIISGSKVLSLEDLKLTTSERKELAELCLDFAEEDIKMFGGNKTVFYLALITSYAGKI